MNGEGNEQYRDSLHAYDESDHYPVEARLSWQITLPTQATNKRT